MPLTPYIKKLEINDGDEDRSTRLKYKNDIEWLLNQLKEIEILHYNAIWSLAKKS